MDKHCIRILEIIESYELQNASGIGMSVLDRKFYREFDFDEAHLTNKIIYLKENGYIKDERPYSITDKGKQVLSTKLE